jgi:LemA protein
MKKALVPIVLVLLVVVGLLCALGSYVVGEYNNLVKLSAETDKAFANVETVLQRRFDLIPNLVASVKGIMFQEQKVFSDIAEARTKYAGSPVASSERVQAANEVEGALSRLLVIMENYPELKSNQNVTALMDELAGTENRISVERQRFNEVVTSFNVKVKTFPINLFAGMLGFNEKTMFKATDGANVAPTVDLTEE